MDGEWFSIAEGNLSEIARNSDARTRNQIQSHFVMEPQDKKISRIIFLLSTSQNFKFEIDMEQVDHTAYFIRWTLFHPMKQETNYYKL